MIDKLRKIKARKIGPVIILRYLTLLLFAVVIIIIGINIISRSGKEAKISLIEEELKEQKVEKREEVLHFEDEKGSLILESKANHQYLGEDGYYHMEGDVLVKFLKRAEGEDVVINGDEVLHDREGSRFILKGNAKIRFKDLVIESPYLEYENKNHVIKTDKGVSFSSGRIKGHGQNMVCWEVKKEVKIKNNVRLELIKDPENSKSIYVNGDEMFYTHKWGNGYVEGRVKLRSEGSTVRTERLEFYLPPDKEFLRSMMLKGNVRGNLVLESEPESNRDSQRYEAKADEVFIRFIKYLDIPEIIEAKGNCLIRSSQADLNFNRIQSENFIITFNRDGKMTGFSGFNDVQVEEGRTRQIKGNKFVLDNKREILTVYGDDAQRAEISSDEYNISADEISSSMNSGDLNARGEITGVFRPSDSQEMGIGIFSGAQPVFIAAESIKYLSEQDRFIFIGNVKLWQEQEMLNTDELVIKKEGSGLGAYGGVQMIFHHENKDGREVEISISSNSMEFDPKKNEILFHQECLMNIKHVKMNAELISIQMEEDKKEIKILTASHSVVIEKGMYEGRGEKAVYTCEEDLIVLTGNPVLIEKNRGETNGDKLTFSMSDDRIIVENRGDERSVTVIKK
jgi:lipopolysaccharide transport protein LptA